MLWASARANGPYQRHPGLVRYTDIMYLLFTAYYLRAFVSDACLNHLISATKFHTVIVYGAQLLLREIRCNSLHQYGQQ